MPKPKPNSSSPALTSPIRRRKQDFYSSEDEELPDLMTIIRRDMENTRRSEAKQRKMVGPKDGSIRTGENKFISTPKTKHKPLPSTRRPSFSPIRISPPSNRSSLSHNSHSHSQSHSPAVLTIQHYNPSSPSSLSSKNKLASPTQSPASSPSPVITTTTTLSHPPPSLLSSAGRVADRVGKGRRVSLVGKGKKTMHSGGGGAREDGSDAENEYEGLGEGTVVRKALISPKARVLLTSRKKQMSKRVLMERGFEPGDESDVYDGGSRSKEGRFVADGRSSSSSSKPINISHQRTPSPRQSSSHNPFPTPPTIAKPLPPPQTPMTALKTQMQKKKKPFDASMITPLKVKAGRKSVVFREFGLEVRGVGLGAGEGKGMLRGLGGIGGWGVRGGEEDMGERLAGLIISDEVKSIDPARFTSPKRSEVMENVSPPRVVGPSPSQSSSHTRPVASHQEQDEPANDPDNDEIVILSDTEIDTPSTKVKSEVLIIDDDLTDDEIVAISPPQQKACQTPSPPQQPHPAPTRKSRKNSVASSVSSIFEPVRKTPKKRVVYSSDEDDDRGEETHNETLDREDESPARSPEVLRRKATPGKLAEHLDRINKKKWQSQRRNRYLTPEADCSDDSSNGENEDDSLGSLADFFAPEGSVTEYDYSGESEGEAEASVWEVTSGSESGSDAEDEGEGLDCVMQFSPGRRLREIEQKSSSDEDVVEIPGERAIPDTRARPPPNRRTVTPPITSTRSVPQTPAEARKEKKIWNIKKHRVVDDLIVELDEKVFGGELLAKCEPKIEWTNRLLKTAGRAWCKRKQHADGKVTYDTKIELAEKVLDNEERLLSTLAHELCHLATWVISEDMGKRGHGKVFMAWGRKVTMARRDIEVTAQHDYTIVRKYQWQCKNESCGVIYGRDSKSVNIDTQCCGKCRSKLQPLFEDRSSAYNNFQKHNYNLAKAALNTANRHEVMKALSDRWRVAREQGVELDQKKHDLFWQEISLNSFGLLAI